VNLPQSRIIDQIADHRDELLNENRQLKQRIKRLEEYGNAMVAHVYCYRTQRKWTEEAYQDLIETIADWEKAKEAKL
jgi:uncharacterized coiled-coil DUF342 family protein